MSFQSILFFREQDRLGGEQLTPPDCFRDLNLDQIVAGITSGKDEYKLTTFYYTPLRDRDSVVARQKLFQDLDDPGLLGVIKRFAENMRVVRNHLAHADKVYYSSEKDRWFLDAVDVYCEAISELANDLSVANVSSFALTSFRDYLNGYAASQQFADLRSETTQLQDALSAIHYSVLIDGSRVEVRSYAGEPDHAAEIEVVFAKFRQGGDKSYAFAFSNSDMNHIEAEILDRVRRLYPTVFTEIEHYYQSRQSFQDSTVLRFDREIQFYVAYVDYIAPLKKAGLRFCYPNVVQSSKEVFTYDGFDLALAKKLVVAGTEIVTNDFHLKNQERIIIVSGPNQGGKTTFARAFGQLHHLASLGLPVPGSRAQLFLFDDLFAHFERQENVENLRGKLQDDLVRLHRIIERATPSSIVILNEIFTSTTLRDAIVLSKKIAAKLRALDLLCVWVTFVDELAAPSEHTVSMTSTVVPENPVVRTYKIVRRPADGLAYALAIAEKHRITYSMIKERIAS